MAAADLFARRSPANSALVLLLALAGATPGAAADGFAIVGATVFDGSRSPALLDGVIVVEGSKVRSVGPRSLVALPKGIPYLDGRGFFVVPGGIREPKVEAALREKVRGGLTFGRALADVLHAEARPAPTLEPGQPADLVLLEKDPSVSLDNLSSAKRVFVAGREVPP